MQRAVSRLPGLWATRTFDPVDPPIAVLVVDDDEELAGALSAALGAYGYRTYVAHDGSAAFRISQSWTPHVILLDIEMSASNGFTVAETMRGTARLATIPIVAHTSLSEAEVIDQGKAVEIDAFYRKGAPLGGLFRMIDHLAPSRTA